MFDPKWIDFLEEIREAMREPLAIHITAITLILLLGCVGNSFVLSVYVNSKYNHRAINVYIKTLAILDLVSCCISAPSTMLLDLYLDIVNESVQHHLINAHITITRFFMISNLGILSVLALDRACALYTPFMYQTLKRRAPVMIQIIFSVSLCETLICAFVPSPDAIKILLGCNITLGFFILLTTYPAIIYTLYRNQRSRVHIAHISQGSFVKTHKEGKNIKETANYSGFR